MYNCCRCRRRHRTTQTFARCIWPNAEEVRGEGTYACVAFCDVTTITLWAEAQGANAAKDQIDRTGCGHDCHRDHHIIDLESLTWK